MIQNAIKFSPTGTKIVVEITHKKHPNLLNESQHLTGKIFTKIIDSGSGIDLTKWGNLKSFNFNGLSHTRETSGVGVGLTTADTLTRALGGSITLTSDKLERRAGTEVIFSCSTTSDNNIETY